MSSRITVLPSIAVALGLGLGLTACASTDDTAGGTTGFWAAHEVGGASEADPPTSLSGIAKRSDLVVLGSIEGAEEGKDYSEDGKPANRTSNLTIRVEEASSGDASKAVVEFTRNPGSELIDIVDKLPQGRYVFYLASWYEGSDGPVYRCASPAKCVVGVTDGSLTTPREPDAAEDLKPAAAAVAAARTTDEDSDTTLTLEDVYSISAAAVPSNGTDS